MAGIREQKRAALRQRLITSAIERIARDGIGAVRARDLARDAGCALGAIYTVFDDLDALFFHAKAEIFRTMDAQLAEVMARAADQSPRERMECLASAYFRFATDNRTTWSALFIDDGPRDIDFPKWYEDALARLMSHISRPLAELDPALSEAALILRTKTIFSAIHGVILLSIQKRPSGVDTIQVPDAMEMIISEFSSAKIQ